SLAGEMLTPEGVLIAGRRVPEHSGILGRAEEIAEIPAALDRVRRFLGEIGGRLGTLGGRIHEIEEGIAAAEALLARETEAVAECRRRQTLVAAEVERLAHEIDTLVAGQAG